MLGLPVFATDFVNTATGAVDPSALSATVTSGVSSALNSAVVIALVILVAFATWRIFRRMVGGR